MVIIDPGRLITCYYGNRMMTKPLITLHTSRLYTLQRLTLGIGRGVGAWNGTHYNINIVDLVQ